MSLIVTGTIGIDTVHTPTAKAERVLGGSAVYFAAAARHLCPVRMVAAVGGDFPGVFRDRLRGLMGVDISGVEERAKSTTFAWGGRYHENMVQRETLFTHLGVLEEPPPRVPEAYRDSAFVFLGNTHPVVQAGMLEQLPQRRLVVADTMDLWISIARPELTKLLAMVDGLALNNDEAEQLTGIKNPVTAARRILAMGPRFVIVKKGEHGCILVHQDGVAALPAYPTEQVIDPTGAGDTFAGGVMGALVQSKSQDPGSLEIVRSAIVYGTVTASFTVESFSIDRLTTISRSDLDARYQEYVRMLRI